MTRVDCDDCSMNFQTKKLYIKHLKSKECTKSKRVASSQGTQPAKKPRIEVQPSLTTNLSQMKAASTQQNSAQYSQKQMEALQSQITQLSQKQKEVLQAQITQKQKQVLQAIPYNQLSEKQKEILKRLSGNKPSVSTAPTTTKISTVASTSAVSSAPIRAGTAPVRTPTPSFQTKDAGLEQNIKKGRRKNVYNKIPDVKTIQPPIAPRPSSAAKSQPSVVSPVEKEPIIKDFVFSDDPIGVDEADSVVETPSGVFVSELDTAVHSIVENQNPLEESVTPNGKEQMDSKVGTLKIKNIASVFNEIPNIVAPTATPKETCPHCKKIFSKSGLQQHIEFKHKVQCGYCEFKFLQDELNEHIQNHMTTCSICKDVMLKDAVESHVESAHKVECEHCKEKMLSTVVEDHIDLIHKKECTFCGDRILTQNMNAHVQKIHEPEECDECGDRFATKSMLKDHIYEFHLVEKCDECTARFRTEDELDQHKVDIHPKEYCDEDECDAVFNTLALLEEHKEKVHPNPNKFVSFNGGMFMMMMQVDEEEECVDEEEEESSAVDDDTNVSEEELAETNEYMKELVIGLADDVVKDKMTGTILFSLRFDETDQDEVSDSDCES